MRRVIFLHPVKECRTRNQRSLSPGKFDDNGKWMDGWESRRKRVEGYDYCIVKLGREGVVKGVDIDTSHFKGDHPPAASIDACLSDDEIPGTDTVWTTILEAVSLKQDSQHLHDISNAGSYSHIRLNIYPDGGMARLRVYGEPQCNWDAYDADEIVDLAALENGGRAIACSNQAFGSSITSLVFQDETLIWVMVGRLRAAENPEMNGSYWNWVTLVSSTQSILTRHITKVIFQIGLNSGELYACGN